MLGFMILMASSAYPFNVTGCNKWLNLTYQNAWNSETLLNFTPLIVVNSSILNYSDTGPSDIRVYNSNNDLLLKDIEGWNTGGNSFIWFKDPSIATTNTGYVNLAYNCSDTNADSSGVWSSYKLVYHLNETAGTAITDASNNNNGTLNSASYWANGTIDGSVYFDGANDYITSNSNIGISGGDSRTYSVWAKLFTFADSGVYIGQGTVYDTADWLVESADANNHYSIRGNGADATYSSTASADDFGIWTMLTYVYNGSNRFIYRNGTEIMNTVKAVTSTDSPLILGRCGAYSACYVNAQMDEARLSNSARSNKWINASYMAGVNKFMAYGNVNTWPEAPPDNTSYLTITSPTFDIPVWNESQTVNFTALPVSSGEFINCSLLINGTEYVNITEVINDTNLNWYIELVNGWYQYFFKCYAVDVFNSSETGSIWVNYTAPEEPELPPVNYSGTTNTRCLSNTTQYSEVVYTLDGITHNRSEITTCQYGCEAGLCNDPPSVQYMTLFKWILILLICIAIIVFIGRYIS